MISFAIAAIGCALAGMCYSELASMIPVSGSAYTYAYATMGEFVAWIIAGTSSSNTRSAPPPFR